MNHKTITLTLLLSAALSITTQLQAQQCSLTVVGPSTLCQNDEGTLTAIIDFPATELATLEWALNGNPIITMPDLPPDSYSLTIFSPGLYTIALLTNSGCIDTTQFFVEEILSPQVEIQGPDCLMPGQTAELIATGDFLGIVWDNGDPVPVLTITEPGTYCATVYNDSLSGNCSVGYECFTVNPANQLEIVATDAFCQDSSSSCQQVCANSLSTYEVQGINDPNTQILWTISGAESYQINGNQASVQWGDAGQGLILVENQSDNTPPMYVVPGQSQGTSVGGIYTIILHIDVFGGSPPYQVQVATDPSGPWTNLSGPPYEYEAYTNALYYYQVTDATGNIVSGEYAISFCNTMYGNIQITYNSDDSYNLTITGEGYGINCSTFSITGDIAISNLPFDTLSGPFGPFPCNQGLSISLQPDCPDYCPHIISLGPLCPTASCPSSDELCVSILPQPEAAFSTTPAAVNDTITLCTQQTLSIENNSNGAATYIWNFGDGQLSADYEPEHTYLNPGFYELTLIARNSCYCSDTSTLIVHVQDAFIPDISCLGTLCECMEMTYTTSADCGTYIWNVSPQGSIIAGGGPNDDFVTVFWSQGPEGYIELTTPGCGATCDQTRREYIPIISQSAQIQGNTEVCFQSVEEYSITEYESGTSFNWYVSGGGTILSGQGTHRITVLWEDQADILGNPQWVGIDYDNCYLKCGGQDTLDVFILPEFFIEGPIAVCESSTESFSTHNTINEGAVFANWQLMDETGTTVWSSASPAATVSVPFNLPGGNYTLLAQADNPSEVCLDEYRLFIQVESAPPALLGINGALEVCPGTPYLYEATGSLPDHNIQWIVNNTGTTQEFGGNPIIANWGDTTPYELSVFQTGSSALQCPSDTIQISPQPIQSFSISGPAEICPEETADFSIPAFENLNPVWSISDEETALLLSGQNTEQISVQGLQSGSVTISVSVCSLSANAQGSLSANANLTILPTPAPVIQAPASICSGETAQVQTTQPYNSYQWYDEGGNLLSTDASPMLGPGHYLLQVTDNFGCTGETAFSIAEAPLPYAHISVPLYGGLCTGGTVNLHATQSESGYTFQWFLNGGPIAGGTNATYTADQIGTYGLVVTNAAGCTATAPDIQLLACEDVGGVCVNGICMPAGIPGTPGGGCSINEYPSYTKTVTTDCFTRQFQNTTITHEPGSMSWYFYDANSQLMSVSTDENPTVTFPPVLGFYPIVQAANMPNLAAPGTYCLIGVLSQDTVKIVPDFQVESSCIGTPTQFTAISQILGGTMPTGYSWDFGDPASGADNTSNLQNPVHTFNAAGDYDVTLSISTDDGCQVSITKTITVEPPPAVDFSLPAQDCEDLSLQFSPVGLPDNITGFLWDFDDPASGSSNSSDFEAPFHSFQQAGSYDVTLTLTNIAGCSSSQTHTFTVFQNQLAGNIDIQPDSLLCPGDTAILTAPGGPGLLSYLWTTGDTVQAISTQDAGVFGVSLSDEHGCTYTPDEIAISLFDLPTAVIQAIEYNLYGQPAAVFEGSYTSCEGEDIFLQVIGSQDYTYIWSTGETGEGISFTEEKDNLLPPGQHDISVLITDPAGCTNEVTFSITVHPLPETPLLAAVPAPPLCEGETATLSVTNVDPALTYTWNTGESGAQIEVIAAGDYYVRATSPEGCSSESEPLTVNAAPPIGQVPSGCFERCDPDTICLPDFFPATNFQWFFNGVPIPAPEGTVPDLIVNEDGTYFVSMTDANGCNSTSDPLTLDLSGPAGDVLAPVWFDLNENEVIDAPDTLVPDINVFLILDGMIIDNDTSNQFGFVLFEDLPSETYLLVIDSTTLPENWYIIIDSLYITVEGTCGSGGGEFPCLGTDPPPADTLLGFLLGIDCIAGVPQDIYYETCANDFIIYDGEIIYPGEMQTFTYTTPEGCDSTITVHVNALPTDMQTLTFNACEGSSIIYNGQDIPAGQTQSFTFTNQFGCDSTVVVEVNAIPAETQTLSFNACEGSSISYNGLDIPAGEAQTFYFVNQFGCDSIIIVDVNALPAETQTLSFQLCPNDSLLFNGEYIYPGEEQDFVLTNQFGCDSIIIVQAMSLPESDFLAEAIDSSCWNDSTGSILISLTNQPVPPYTYSMDGENFQDDSLFQHLPEGEYTVWIQDANGCLFPKNVSLPGIRPLTLSLDDATIECASEGALLEPLLINPSGTEVLWQWPDGSGENTWFVQMPGEYMLIVSDQCETLQVPFNISYEADAEGLPVYVPNAFSPNGDGLNDCFKPEFAPDVKVITYTFRVFDRWGNFLFDATGPDDCWDGTFRDQIMDPAVFVWYLEATVQYCHQAVSVFEKGDVTIVK